MQKISPAEYSAEYYYETRRLVVDGLRALPFYLVSVEGIVQMVFDSATRLLWNTSPTVGQTLPQIVGGDGRIGGIGHWRLPTSVELAQFYDAKACPGRARLGFFVPGNTWQTITGVVPLGERKIGGVQDPNTHVIGVNDFVGNATIAEMVDICMERNWSLHDPELEAGPDFLSPLRSVVPMREQYRDLDYRTTRLPKLEAAQFDDPAKGVWECWGMAPEVLRAERVLARNPADDIRDWDVAIDFGTSSTVVAYEEHGKRKLLRTGISNFSQKDNASNYENPTMLEFLDWEGLLEAWQSVAYRPQVDWNHVRASHAALNDFRASSEPHALVGSLINNLKQWALLASDGAREFIRDAAGVERELLPLDARNPVLGAPLVVGPEDPFDPVELYAWLLGLNINWRGRGLFLRYAMTFPVAYPQLIKDKILASFRRGLQRSLPTTLVNEPVFSRFKVEEVASEPAAYAIAALPSLGIAPSASGVAYSVFDFGGGTADFDFGIYRLPKDEEHEDLEQILERFGAAGDRHLGGENLLANMAYRVFRQNLSVCEEQGIVFSRPLDADEFKGHERFVEQSRIATTNMVLVANALRPLWEGGVVAQESSKLSLSLLNRSGQSVICHLLYPEAELKAYLEQRIGEGIYAFLVAMGKSFSANVPQEIQVLLAGNSSRSQLVVGYFGLSDDEGGQRLYAKTQSHLTALFGDEPPRLIVHPALSGKDDDLFQPTAKTGVALGLLRLCDGGVVAVVDSTGTGEAGEAPFAYYVGRIRQGKFKSALMQGQGYRAWVEIARLRDRVFKLSYTHSPLAYTGDLEEGAGVLCQVRIELAGEVAGQGIFVRAVGPAEIEVCTAPSAAEIDTDGADNLQRIKLG